jgi:hypothetical protein
VGTYAEKYHLRLGDGSKVSDYQVGFGRLLDEVFNDSEQAGSLKYLGIGNCAEWSHGFGHILDGAGVINNRIVFADDSPGVGHGARFIDNDTALWLFNPKIKGETEKVFDIFRRFYHNEDPGWYDLSPAPWLKKVQKKQIKDGASEIIIYTEENGWK